jgi:pimeloyl-ACP methyl ester carboxylesterase
MRKTLRRSLRVAGVLFLLMNIVAALHAWRFTHFEAIGANRTSSKNMGFSKKLGFILTGVNNPKPLNTTLPDTAFQTITIKSNEKLEAWWIPVASPRGSVLLCHGYGGSKAGMLERAKIFRGLGYSTMLLDFMGAGGSEGRQCTIGVEESVEIRDAVKWMQQQGARQIILFGTSMGAAAVMKAQAEFALPVCGLVLECPFGSLAQSVENRFRVQGMPTFPLAKMLVFWGGAENGFNAFAHNPINYALKIQCPVLLFYGEKDNKVLPSETNAIMQNLAGSKRLVTFADAAHEDYLMKYKCEWQTAVAEFTAAN